MQWFVKALASVGFLGYVPKAPGTAGSVAGLMLGLLVPPPLTHAPSLGYVGCLAGGFLIGVIVSTASERAFGHVDPPQVVIDECWAMWALMAAIPVLCYSLPLALVAFGLFRIFDILKPFPLKWLARLPGGWGIMLDDVGAAGYVAVLWWVLATVVCVPR